MNPMTLLTARIKTRAGVVEAFNGEKAEPDVKDAIRSLP